MFPSHGPRWTGAICNFREQMDTCKGCRCSCKPRDIRARGEATFCKSPRSRTSRWSLVRCRVFSPRKRLLFCGSGGEAASGEIKKDADVKVSRALTRVRRQRGRASGRANSPEFLERLPDLEHQRNVRTHLLELPLDQDVQKWNQFLQVDSSRRYNQTI